MKPPTFTLAVEVGGLSCVYPQVVILRAVVESPDGERRRLEVVAATFEQGCAELDQLRPDGWREMHVIVDRT